MRDVIEFKEWKKLHIICGKIEEISERTVLVNINSEELIACDKGGLDYNIGNNVIVLLRGPKEGRLLAVINKDKIALLIPEKDIDNGARIE